MVRQTRAEIRAGNPKAGDGMMEVDLNEEVSCAYDMKFRQPIRNATAVLTHDLGNGEWRVRLRFGNTECPYRADLSHAECVELVTAVAKALNLFNPFEKVAA